jgi:WD40 repeat protein
MFPDGYSVLSGSDDKTCRLFDMRSDCQLSVYGDTNLVNSPVSKLEFSPSGRLFFASYEDGTLSAWDVLRGTWMGELTKGNGPSCMITSIQASANGSRLYTSSLDGMVSRDIISCSVLNFSIVKNINIKFFFPLRFADIGLSNDFRFFLLCSSLRYLISLVSTFSSSLFYFQF